MDLSSGIAGAYCSKLLADAWADVVRAGPVPSAYSRVLDSFLNGSKRSLAGGLPAGLDAACAADIVVEDSGPGSCDIRGLRQRNPSLVVVSISAFGASGPWARRPATEFTMQAECSSISPRGTSDRPPVQAGGRLGEWAAGTYGAVAALAAWRQARLSGHGEHVDVSMFESMCLIHHPYHFLAEELGGTKSRGPSRTVDVPSIEPSADGYVGFCTITAQQFQDFCRLIGRPDLFEDEALRRARTRYLRRDEVLGAIHAWTTRRSTADILEHASALRIPAAPVGNGATIPAMGHFRERQVFVRNAQGVLQPRVPYRIEGLDPRPFGPPPPRPGPSIWEPRALPEGAGPGVAAGPGPLDGLRVVDLTAFWAGPAATQLLAALGADVVKVESVQRPDPMRFNSADPSATRWWEYGAVFLVANTGKRAVTLDLSRPEGMELARRLIAEADVVIENYTPRVMEHFGLDGASIRAMNEAAVFVRMPAFGLDGPWRDRPGLAQTMEQVSGLAWLTGYPDVAPIIPRGPCDPIAGMHAVLALLVALELRDQTGRGMMVEVPMVESILNIAAEGVGEYSASGHVLARQGNRGPDAAPQGVYPCLEEDRWVAIAVSDDAQWSSLVDLMGRPTWATGPDLATASGRRRAHDTVDEGLAGWSARHPMADVVERLVAAGIPAGAVVAPHEVPCNPQLAARRFYEEVDHPVVGRRRHPGLPFRFASRVDPWLRGPAPTLGQHNAEILGGELGLTASQLRALEDRLLVGTRPVGV